MPKQNVKTVKKIVKEQVEQTTCIGDILYYIDKRANKIVQGRVLSIHTIEKPIFKTDSEVSSFKNSISHLVNIKQFNIQTSLGVTTINEEKTYKSFSVISRLFAETNTEYID